MPKLGIGSSLIRAGLTTPGIVTDSLVLKHNYAAGGVVPVSDGAAFFDFSADDYIEVADHADLRLGTNDFSLCAWIYTSDVSNDQPIFGKREGPNDRWYWMISGSSQTLVLYGRTGSVATVLSATSTSTFSTNRWYHVAVTCDRNGNTLTYIDGVLDDTDSTPAEGTTDLGDNVALWIGARTTTDTFGDGYICNAGFWNETILTQPQIKSIMWKNYAGLTSTETTNLVSWWNLDEAVGDNSSHVVDSVDTSLGEEINTTANATSPTNETDAVTGWTDGGGTPTQTSDSSVVDTSNYSLKMVTNANEDYIIANWTVETGKVYKTTVRWKTITTPPNLVRISWGSGQGLGDYYSPYKDGSTDWTTTTAYITTTGTALHLFLQESSATDNIMTMYVDNISIKKVQGNYGTLS